MRDIIILGCGDTRWECPYDTETWGLNSTINWAERLGRLDKLFFFDIVEKFKLREFQNMLNTKAELITTPHNLEFLKPLNKIVTLYPLKEVIKKLGRPYFTNSITYMIAYAIYLGDIDKISLYGVDHQLWAEYAMERPGVEYWVGRAEGAGIEVEITQNSALCKTKTGKLYGYNFQYGGEELSPLAKGFSDDIYGA